MAKTRRLGMAILLLALIAGAMWIIARHSEPRVGRIPLSLWLSHRLGDQNDYTDDGDASLVGTNAIPELLRMVQTRDSRIRDNVAVFLSRCHIYRLKTAQDYRLMASVGFEALGSRGQPAVPQLIQLLDSPDRGVSGAAAECLGAIGPDAKMAIPRLMRLLDDTNEFTINCAVFGLGGIHSEPQIVVPALVARLNATNRSFVIVSLSLGEFGTNAAPAVPILREILSRTNAYRTAVLKNAANALHKIAPELPAPAATNR